MGDEEEHRAGAEEYAGQQHLHDAGTDQRARQRIEPVEEGHHRSRAAKPARDVRCGVDIDTLRGRAATVKVIIFGDRIHVALRHKAEIEQRGQQQGQRAHQPAGQNLTVKNAGFGQRLAVQGNRAILPMVKAHDGDRSDQRHEYQKRKIGHVVVREAVREEAAVIVDIFAVGDDREDPAEKVRYKGQERNVPVQFEVFQKQRQRTRKNRCAAALAACYARCRADCLRIRR